MSTPLEKELAETKSQLLSINSTNADLQEALIFAQTERDEALILRHEAYDMLNEEREARLTAEAELATLRATHIAVLRELDDLCNAVAGQFMIGE
jgi:hypothetical protein